MAQKVFQKGSQKLQKWPKNCHKKNVKSSPQKGSKDLSRNKRIQKNAPQFFFSKNGLNWIKSERKVTGDNIHNFNNVLWL